MKITSIFAILAFAGVSLALGPFGGHKPHGPRNVDVHVPEAHSDHHHNWVPRSEGTDADSTGSGTFVTITLAVEGSQASVVSGGDGTSKGSASTGGSAGTGSTTSSSTSSSST